MTIFIYIVNIIIFIKFNFCIDYDIKILSISNLSLNIWHA